MGHASDFCDDCKMIKNFIFCAAPLPPSLVTSGNEEGEEEKAKSHQSQRHTEKQCSAMVRSRQWRPNQAAAPAEVSARRGEERRGEESGGVSAQRTQSQSHSPAPFSPTTSRVRQKRQEREKEKEKEKDFELT
jgi:hypothetical protein